MAKCNFGEVKLKRIGLWLSPIAACDKRGGPLGSCRTTLGFVASVVYCIVALLADHMTDQLFLFGKSLWILAPSPPSLPGGWWFLK